MTGILMYHIATAVQAGVVDPTPTYSLTPAANNIDEGSSLTIDVSGTNITNGTYYWTISDGMGGDFGTNFGSFNITSNAGSFTVTPTADTTTEGSETFTVSIRSGSTVGPVLETTSTITINDTSTTPAPIINSFSGKVISFGAAGGSSTSNLVPSYASGSIATFTGTANPSGNFIGATYPNWLGGAVVTSSGSRILLIHSLRGVTTSTTDGDNWTDGERLSPNGGTGTVQRWVGLATNSTGTWVTVRGGVPAAGTSTTAAYSTNDGANWNYITVPEGSWGPVQYGGGRFVCIASNSGGGTIYSTDGINWSSGGTLTAALGTGIVTWKFNFIYAAGSLNAFYILREAVGQLRISSSTDGTSWSTYTNYTATGVAGSGSIYAAWGNGTFVVLQFLSNNSWTSTDGTTWTRNANPFTSTSVRFTSLIFFNGRFVASTNFLSGTDVSATWISIDGVTWEIGGTSTGIANGGILCYLSS